MKYRVGDLIKYKFGNNFGKILDIIDIDKNSFAFKTQSGYVKNT